MNLFNKRIVLTGATGGIGRELTKQLAEEGARLVLVGRNHAALASLCSTSGAQALSFDLGRGEDHERLMRDAIARLGGLDILINNAAEGAFTGIEAQSPEQMRRMLNINLLAPMLLSRAAIAHMRPGARIVNIGSVFGNIAFPYHATYSATKFGLRGFSEALRRELSEREIGVTYVAPRATRTGMNSPALYRYAARTHMALDNPDMVAQQILKAIEEEAAERILGRSESFFSRLNGLFPRLVDHALRKEAGTARETLEEPVPPSA